MREECVEVGDEEWQLSKDSADAATARLSFLSTYIIQVSLDRNHLKEIQNGLDRQAEKDERCESLERKQKAESKP